MTLWSRRQYGRCLADDISKCIFVEWRHLSFKAAVYFSGYNWQQVCIGSDNGLAPNSLQAIVWSNDDPAHGRIYAPPGHNELNIWLNRDLYWHVQPWELFAITPSWAELLRACNPVMRHMIVLVSSIYNLITNMLRLLQWSKSTQT